MSRSARSPSAGSLSFFIFAGILIPLVSSLAFIPLRRILPSRAWIAGTLFGLLLLATFGVSDPLSPDNVDFSILSPLWLAVTLVCLTALLFGTTFSALVAWLDATLVPLNQLRSDAPRRWMIANVSLVWLLIALPLAVPATVYVAARAIVHGRLAPVVASSGLRVGRLRARGGRHGRSRRCRARRRDRHRVNTHE